MIASIEWWHCLRRNSYTQHGDVTRLVTCFCGGRKKRWFFHFSLAAQASGRFASHSSTQLTNHSAHMRTSPRPPVGDHIFQCRHIDKIGAHNSIRDGLTTIPCTLSSPRPGACSPRQNSMSSHSSTYRLTHTPAHSIYPSIPDPTSPPTTNHACPLHRHWL